TGARRDRRRHKPAESALLGGFLALEKDLGVGGHAHFQRNLVQLHGHGRGLRAVFVRPAAFGGRGRRSARDVMGGIPPVAATKETAFPRGSGFDRHHLGRRSREIYKEPVASPDFDLTSLIDLTAVLQPFPPDLISVTDSGSDRRRDKQARAALLR